MANTSGINNQSVPKKDESQSAECPPDNKLPENSQANLDARLDHAIEETFPTSDPISVTITKGPEPDRPDQEARTNRGRTQLSKFWIRSGKPCTTLQSKRLDKPVNCIIEATATSNKQESDTQRPSGTFAPASEP